MRKLAIVIILAIPSFAMAQTKASNVFGDPNYFQPRVSLSELKDNKLDEVSGIAASKTNPGFIWAQNDSGNRPQVYLLDKNLNIRLTVKLKGVMNRDWEDIAVGPGPEAGKSYIYVADIGDNLGIFPTKMIYRFLEPVYDSLKGEKEVDAEELKPIIFRLPGGDVRDSESMLLDPITKNLYILSKEDTARLYQIKFPYVNTQTKNDTLMADFLGLFSIPKVTAGSISKNGEEILLKNYRRVWYWKNPSHKPIEEVLKVKGIMIPYDMEPQGEAISWAYDGTGFFTLSELKKDKKSFLYFYKRK
jgi:hypothetical protein